MELVYDEAKFTEMVVYIAGRLLGDRAGGTTKLNKVVFFAEFSHFRRHGQVISGCEFQKLQHGPAPRPVMPVRKRLVAAGEAQIREEDFLGRKQHRLVPLRDADLSVFTDLERQTIDDVLEQLSGLTARQVSDLSHDEPGWKLTEIGETIPYAMAGLVYRQVSTPTSRRLARDAAERYGFVVPADA
ncbi:MAG: SocA family protein [Rhodococcus sp.]|nr:SocA family protein [Rhodococcus sp. (in: high G+C Gram-positive bacteria)]